MNHFLYSFLSFSEKKEEYLLPRSLIFFKKMHHRIPFVLALRLPVRRFQTPLEGLSFVKMLLTIGVIYATDPLPKYN